MLGSLSLRTRFLIAPMIGVLLTLIIYFTSSGIINSQNHLFKKINESDLIQISEINRSIAQLAAINSGIVTLLLDSKALDEEQIYLTGKDLLHELYNIEENLTRTINQSEPVVIDNKDIFAQIIAAFSSYKSESIIALEMAAVDPSQALYELTLANRKLITLNQLFFTLSEYHLQQITLKANEINGSLSEKTYLNEISIFLVILMIGISFYFANKMSASLMQVYNALIRLSQGDSDIKVLRKRDKYVKHLWTAVAKFKESLNSNQKQKGELLILKYAIDQHSIVSQTDIDGNIIYANQKFADITGYTNEELIGQNHRLVNSGNKPKAYWHAMYQHIASGEIWHDQVKNKNKSGQPYWVDTTIIPIKESLATGKITGYMSIRTDISQRVKQEQVLIEAKKEAEAATKAKSQFLANMSHEIRTPMNGVIGMTQLLKDTPLNNEQKDYLNAISHSGNNLVAIINDILDFSKLDFDAVELESISFNLERICLECIKLISNNCHDSNVEFIFDYHPGISRYFTGDPARIRQIIINLLGNAAKFTAQGHISLTVSYACKGSENEGLTIEVQDTGIGIKTEAMAHLFDEFSQADSSTTRRFGGTGLGLSISKKLINLMNGSISVESIYQQGSRFFFTIPLTESTGTALPANQTLTDVNILVFDTNSQQQQVLKRQLDHMKANTTVVTDKKQAILALYQANNNNSPYQLLIIDGASQHEEAITLAENIRANELYQHLKLVVISSVSKSGDASRYENAGFNAYLSKLTSQNTLLSILSAALAHKEGQTIITQHVIEDARTYNIEKRTFIGKVLLVEDVRVNQIIAHKMLVNMGLSVDIANNGQEAIEAVEQQQYDLIFMDCQMPIMDGYQATIKIREMESEQQLPAIPIIALTANATKEDIIICKQSKMDDIVTKPYEVIDLQTSLDKWLPTKIDPVR